MADPFTGWMSRVDSILESALGLSSMDLPDVAYRDLFESETHPADAAAIAIADAGGDADLILASLGL